MRAPLSYFVWLSVLLLAACPSSSDPTGIQVFVVTDYTAPNVREVRVQVSGVAQPLVLPAHGPLAFYLKPTGELDATVRVELRGFAGGGATALPATPVHAFTLRFEPQRETLAVLALRSTCSGGERAVDGPLPAWTGTKPAAASAALEACDGVMLPPAGDGGVDTGPGPGQGDGDAGIEPDAEAMPAPSAWAVRSGGLKTDYWQHVATDREGNVFAAGSFQGDALIAGSLLTSEGGQDIYVAKYDARGAPLWVKQFGGAGDGRALGLTVDRNGDPIVAGWFEGEFSLDEATTSTSVDTDGFIVALANGAGASEPTVRWFNTFGGNALQTVATLRTTPEGGLVVAGDFASTMTDRHALCGATLASGTMGMYVARLDPTDGRCAGVQTFAGSAGCGNVRVAVGPEGQVAALCSYIWGDMRVGSGDTEYVFPHSQNLSTLVVLLTRDLELTWARSLGRGERCADQWVLTQELGFTKTGQLLVVGGYRVCMDLTGPGVHQALAPRRLAANWLPFVLQLTAAGSPSTPPFLAIPTPGEDATDDVGVHSFALDEQGGFVLTGGIVGDRFDFGLGLGEAGTSQGGQDAFVARYDADGTALWVDQFGGPGPDIAHASAFDAEGRVVVGGEFFDSAHPHGANAIEASGDQDAFLVRYAR